MKRRLAAIALVCLLLLAFPVSATPQVFTEHPIADGYFEGAISVYAADVDQDGDLDVLAAARNDNEIAWWENDGSKPPGWTQHLVSYYPSPRSLHAADLDGDGDVDILGASKTADDITWWESSGGATPTFSLHTIDSWYVSPTCVYAADLDGDGDVDVLATASQQGISWWENDGTDSPDFAANKHIIKYDFGGAMSVHAADVDGDGDMDVLGAAGWDGDITWWENRGGTPPSFREHVIEGEYERANCVYASDVDRDDDMDVLSAVGGTINDITWWENDGSEHFTEHTINDFFDGATAVHAVDVDGDSDVDVLGAASRDDDITWWENDPSGGAPPADPISWTEHTIKGDFQGAFDVYATDLDSDGDVDVLGAAYEDYDITWWENLQDFSVSCSNPSQAVPAGGAAAFDIAVTTESGFRRPVTLSVDALPPGDVVSFSANPITPTASSVMTVTTDVSTPSGTHELLVVGTSLSRTHSITLTLGVQNFDILNETPPQVLLPHGWVTFTVTLTSVNGFDEKVQLTAEDLPPQYGALLVPNPVIPSGAAVMTVTAGSTALTEPHELQVVGTAGSLAHSTTAVLDPPYSLLLICVMKNYGP